jgi:hypothetical protein
LILKDQLKLNVVSFFSPVVFIGFILGLDQWGLLVNYLRLINEKVFYIHEPEEAGIHEEKNITRLHGYGISAYTGTDWSKIWNESGEEHRDVDIVHKIVVIFYAVSKSRTLGDLIIAHYVHKRDISTGTGAQNK